MSRQFRTFPLAAPTAATTLRGRSRKQCRNVRFRAWRGGRRHRLEVVDALGDIADGTGIGLVFLGNTLCRNTSCLSSGYLSALCLLLCALRVRIRRGIALTLYKRNKSRKARCDMNNKAMKLMVAALACVAMNMGALAAPGGHAPATIDRHHGRHHWVPPPPPPPPPHWGWHRPPPPPPPPPGHHHGRHGW